MSENKRAFLGTGLLGSGFVRAMLGKGQQVQVWNRSINKAQALEQYGATAFENASDAVKGVQVIHIALKDDAVVDSVLAQAKPGLEPGAVIIDHTTTSVSGATERTANWKAAGFTYLHAPVFMGPSNALESTGNMLVSGDQEVIVRYEQELSKMTGKLINLGDTEGKAAGMKLAGNLFLLSLTAGLADALALTKAVGISPAEVTDLFTSWNPASSLGGRMSKMSGGDFSNPSWELDMARKDAGLMLAEAEKGGQNLPVIAAVAKVMDSLIAEGHGSEDWMVIAKNSI